MQIKLIFNIWWQIEQKTIAVANPGTHASRSGKMIFAATRKMYKDKISQIKFYYSRYCSRKRKTFGGKINIAVAPGTHASRSGN